MKLLNIRDFKISSINFGPYDNGHLLLGLSSGVLLAIDLVEMEVIMQLQLFKSGVKSIVFEPTNLVFVSSEDRELTAISIIKKEKHYVYYEMGKRQYCTIAY
jgi:hypothetical protein